MIIEDLLHMTSGLPHNEDWKTKARSQLLHWDDQDTLKELIKYHPAPGQKFHYSNLGYVLAAQIVARIEKKPFGEVLRERIFHPFQMNRTYLQDGPQIDAHLARGRLLIFGRWLAMSAWNYSFLKGAGGIISNVQDLWKWNQGLDRFFALHPELRARYYGLDNPFHYGYGWSVEAELSTHDGESPGFCAYVTKSKHALLLLTLNSDFCVYRRFQDSMESLANDMVTR